MSSRDAFRLCPQAISVRGNHARYSDFSKRVTKIIDEMVPLYQKASVDEFYIDLTGTDRFFDPYQLATEVRQRIIRETKLPISFGLASGRTIAKMATNKAKPNGQLFVPHGSEMAFLAPLPISAIPGLGENTCKKFYEYGIEKIGDLQKVHLKFLETVFGRNGLWIWERARGIDHGDVIPHSDRKSISTECTFHTNISDRRTLESTLVSMTEELSSKLRRENKLASCLAIKIRYANFETHTQQEKINFTSAEHILIPGVKNLLGKVWNQNRPVRLIGVRLSQLTTGSYQINLFEDNEQQIRLYQALDRINFKFGDKTICRAAGMEVGTRNFNPFMRD
jgi:DNA polymerase-4